MGLILKIWAKLETNFCFCCKVFWYFLDFWSLTIHRYIHWSTLTDRNGGSDFLDCWNSGIKGFLNIKKIILEQVLGVDMTFHWVIWLKSRAGQKDPPPGDNVIPEPRLNRVKVYRLDQRVLGLTWRPRRMSFFVDQKPEEISKNDGNTI